MATAEELNVIVEAKVAGAIRDLKKFDKQTNKSEKSTRDFAKSMLKRAAAGAAAAASVGKLISLGRESVELYGAQVQAEQKLAAAIRTTGGDVDELLPQYKALASSIQNVTTEGDESTLALIQQAKSMGVADDQIENATKGAIGLSKALGIGTQQAIRGVSNALNGEFTTLQRYIPALRTTEDESEKLAIVQQAMADGFETAKAEADNAYGSIQQMNNAVGDYKEVAGQAIAQGLQPLVEGFTTWIQRLTTAKQELMVVNDLVGEGLTVDEDLVSQLGLTELNRKLEIAQSNLEDMNEAQGAGADARAARAQALVDSLQAEISARAELTKWQGIESEELSKREEAAKAAAEEEAAATTRRRKNLELLQSEYEKTDAYQKQALESLIAKFEGFEVQGPKTKAILENLRSELEKFNEEANEGTLNDAMAAYSERNAIAQTWLEKEMERINLLKVADKGATQEVTEDLEEQMQRRIDATMNYVNSIYSAYSGLTSSINDLRQNQHNVEIQAIEDEIQAAKDAGEDTTELEKKKQDKIRAFRREQWQAEKRGKLLQATISTAQAVTEALPNLILAAAVGALGAAQIGTIAATDNPYRSGGVINEPVYGTGQRTGQSYSFGEAGPEQVTPRAGGGDGEPMSGDLYLDGDKVGRWMERRMRSRRLLVPREAVV